MIFFVLTWWIINEFEKRLDELFLVTNDAQREVVRLDG